MLKLFGPVRQYMGFYMKHCLVGPLLNYSNNNSGIAPSCEVI